MQDFDHIYPRVDTDSVKWDSIKTTYGKDDLVPLWVADMDFMAPTPVIDALSDYTKRGLFGYSLVPDALYQAIFDWEKTHYSYSLEKEDILFSPGVVPSIGVAIQAYTQPGDSILIHDPVYHPFANMVKANERNLVTSPLGIEDGHFVMDLTDMEAKIKNNQVKMLILCNPHNPGGRVWTKAELIACGLLCQQYGVLVVSDEIHQDLVFAPYQHHSFHTSAPDFADFSIILTAATKTFNLAAVKLSMVYIKNKELRAAFQKVQSTTEQNTINTFGYVATQAAYEKGEPWRQELLAYLAENSRYTEAFFKEHLPQVKVMAPEGTYLMWLDFRAYDLSPKALEDKLVQEAGVVLNNGAIFGNGGRGFMRLNLACPRETLAEGLERIRKVFG
ncbi:pyridoxal phosphate-dependent aminotransferase [Enterococcus asini]|uniref:cysteine-S-conjugate beta-lyase n=1 Tax=Enterococcus asini TaxID=57732 RepID=A0AAW8TX43_9ENTE|nr:MalY/PatB family protein [Enterococcus asini]MDT2808992.1 pyridoxal phosphate-dependent aminotransferase [Enterococcus asini]